MTEPAVASSDATNIACGVSKENGMYVINGRKWWSSGAMDPRCKVLHYSSSVVAVATAVRNAQVDTCNCCRVVKLCALVEDFVES